MGFSLTKLIAASAVISYAAAGVGHARNLRDNFEPNLSVGDWIANPGERPLGDALRDQPEEVNRIFTYGAQPPVFVSIARVTGANSFRAPDSYLLDPDGQMLNDRLPIRPPGERFSHYVMQIAQGHDNTLLVIHWVQAPGDLPHAEASDLPRKIAKSVLLHKPFFVCDAWVQMRTDANGAALRNTLMQFADSISDQIRHQKVSPGSQP